MSGHPSPSRRHPVVEECLAAWPAGSDPGVRPGEFVFAAAGLQHGHIHAQCRGLIEIGGTLKWVWDRESRRVEEFRRAFPQARPARTLDEILDDPEVRLVAGADVPCDRAALGCRVLQAGKDYFTDKPPFTSLQQLEHTREVARVTGRRYWVFYGERVANESAMLAGELVRRGVIGQVVQVLGLGPHRLGPPRERPAWFFEKAKYGGIICDIGSHQFDAFLHYSGAGDARVLAARVANVDHPQFPGLEDLGEGLLVGDNGVSFYFRVDWLTPAGLRSFGDGRLWLVGTRGTIELRKFVDVATDRGGNQLYLVTDDGEFHYDLRGRLKTPFFRQLVRDVLERTDEAMPQSHVFKSAELCLRTQAVADAAIANGPEASR